MYKDFKGKRNFPSLKFFNFFYDKTKIIKQFCFIIKNNNKCIKRCISFPIFSYTAFSNRSVIRLFRWKCFFNGYLNHGCLVYMFSLRFSGIKFLINLRRQFRVRKIFRTQVFAGFAACILCLKLLYRKCGTYVVGCSFIKTCSLTGS